MRSKELEAALKSLDLTPASCGRFLGVTQRAVTHWLDGARKVPEPTSRFLRYMLAKGLTPGEVMKAIGLEGPHLPPSKRK